MACDKKDCSNRDKQCCSCVHNHDYKDNYKPSVTTTRIYCADWLTDFEKVFMTLPGQLDIINMYDERQRHLTRSRSILWGKGAVYGKLSMNDGTVIEANRDGIKIHTTNEAIVDKVLAILRPS